MISDLYLIRDSGCGKMRVYGFRIFQWGKGEGAGKIPLYVAAVPAGFLAAKAEIARRTKDRKKGYQRELSPTRLGKGVYGVTGYLLNQMGIFPTSILVNIRKSEGEVKFEKIEQLNDNIEIGYINIPDNVRWYVLDGQHRLEGLKAAMREYSEFEKYPVIITLTNEDEFYEVLTFYIVNDRAKSVPTDLAYRLLQRMLLEIQAPKWVERVLITGAAYRKAVAANVVDYLNYKPNSPFRGKIREVGEPPKPEHIIKDAVLIRYVAEIMKEKTFEGLYDEELADLLIDYWGAIAEIYPKCFERPKDYMLLSTIGISSFSKLFPTIYAYCARDGDVSRRNMKKYLSYLLEKVEEQDLKDLNVKLDVDFRRPIDERWWHKVDGPGIIHGTGEGHYKRIAENFAKKIAIVIAKKRKSK